MMRIITILLLLAAAISIPLFYYDLITYMVAYLNTGWVFTTIFLRVMVIIFFILALNIGFSFFKRTSKIKFVYVALIGIAPGFGISFIAPIWNTDYGDLSDDLKLETVDILEVYTKNAYQPNNERHIVAFFSTDCGHCKNVARKIGINQMGGQEIKVNAFFMEPPAVITQFLAENAGHDFHAFQISNQDLFLSISGFTFPSVFLIDRDESTLKHWSGDVVNYTALDYLKGIEP